MKVGMISLGCPKNRVASEQMLQKLTDAGYELTNDETEAEAIVINTCAFIEDAKQEAINTILETAQLKETGKLRRLIVAGCLSELYRGEIISEMPEVDAVIGAGSYDDVVTALEGAERDEKPVIIGDNCAAVSETGRVISTGDVWAYLLIADGCDNHCSYCLIPKIRGRFRSRPMDKVLAEARQLAERGYKELILVAQDLTHYGFDLYGKPSLSELLRELCKIDGLRWIRLHYLYPRELDDELIEVKVTDDTEDIFLATKYGLSIRFKESDVRITGRVSYGVIGMKLDPGDQVIGMQMESQGEYMLVASEKGYGKRTRISEFKSQLRNGRGLLCYNVTEKTGCLVGMKLVDDERDIMLITNEGILIRMSVDDISVIGRNTLGVKLMSIDPDSNVRVATIAKVRESSHGDGEEDGEEIKTDLENGDQNE